MIVIRTGALGRTQELLHLVLDLCRQGKLPRLQVCFGWSVEAPAPGMRVDL